MMAIPTNREQLLQMQLDKANERILQYVILHELLWNALEYGNSPLYPNDLEKVVQQLNHIEELYGE